MHTLTRALPPRRNEYIHGIKLLCYFKRNSRIILISMIFINVQGVQEKMCFFTAIHCNPSLAYIASKFSTQCECTVTPIGW